MKERTKRVGMLVSNYVVSLKIKAKFNVGMYIFDVVQGGAKI